MSTSSAPDLSTVTPADGLCLYTAVQVLQLSCVCIGGFLMTVPFLALLLALRYALRKEFYGNGNKKPAKIATTTVDMLSIGKDTTQAQEQMMKIRFTVLKVLEKIPENWMSTFAKAEDDASGSQLYDAENSGRLSRISTADTLNLPLLGECTKAAEDSETYSPTYLCHMPPTQFATMVLAQAFQTFFGLGANIIVLVISCSYGLILGLLCMLFIYPLVMKPQYRDRWAWQAVACVLLPLIIVPYLFINQAETLDVDITALGGTGASSVYTNPGKHLLSKGMWITTECSQYPAESQGTSTCSSTFQITYLHLLGWTSATVDILMLCTPGFKLWSVLVNGETVESMGTQFMNIVFLINCVCYTSLGYFVVHTLQVWIPNGLGLVFASIQAAIRIYQAVYPGGTSYMIAANSIEDLNAAVVVPGGPEQGNFSSETEPPAITKIKSEGASSAGVGFADEAAAGA